MSVLVFAVRVKSLEDKLSDQASEICPLGRIYYPHWLAEMRISFRFPLIGERTRTGFAVVDGVNGMVQVMGDNVSLEKHPSMREHSSRCVPFVVNRRSIDESRLRRAVLAYTSRSLRNWTNISVDVVRYSVLFKEMRVYRVHFPADVQRTLVLDTLTGEYGVISRRVARLLGDMDMDGCGRQFTLPR